MTEYVDKSLVEKIALSPSFTVGSICGMATGAFNKVRGEINSSSEELLHDRQPYTHTIGQCAYPLMYFANLAVKSEIISTLSALWTPVAIIADGARKDGQGRGFSAMRAGYQYGKSFY